MDADEAAKSENNETERHLGGKEKEKESKRNGKTKNV